MLFRRPSWLASISSLCCFRRSARFFGSDTRYQQLAHGFGPVLLFASKTTAPPGAPYDEQRDPNQESKRPGWIAPTGPLDDTWLRLAAVGVRAVDPHVGDCAAIVDV